MTEQLILENLPEDVLDHVLSLPPESKTVYFTKITKKYYPKIDIKNNEEDKETFGKFSDIFFDHYESDNQITFFVAKDEEQYTLNELTDILI